MVKIYTAGKMAGLTYNQQMEWREKLERLVREKTDKPVTFIQPPKFYSYSYPSHKTEKEVMDWDLEHLKECDIVAVNLEGVTQSIGTHFELATANAINQTGHKHIYTIGFNKSDQNLHPWIELSLHRYEETIEQAADYIVEYLMV